MLSYATNPSGRSYSETHRAGLSRREGLACRFQRLGAYQDFIYQDFIALGACPDTRNLVHALALMGVAGPCRLTAVHADPHLRREAVAAPVLDQTSLNGHRVLQGRVGTGEGDEVAIAAVLEILSAVRGNDLLQGSVVPEGQKMLETIRRQARQTSQTPSEDPRFFLLNVLRPLVLIGYGYVLFYAKPRGIVSESTSRRLSNGFFVASIIYFAWPLSYMPR